MVEPLVDGLHRAESVRRTADLTEPISPRPPDAQSSTHGLRHNAERFMWTNARLIDRLRFDHLFGVGRGARRRRPPALPGARRRLRRRRGGARLRARPHRCCRPPGSPGLLYAHGIDTPWLGPATDYCWRALAAVPERVTAGEWLLQVTYVERSQADDGGWTVPWEAWVPLAGLEWRGWRTVERLKICGPTERRRYRLGNCNSRASENGRDMRTVTEMATTGYDQLSAANPDRQGRALPAAPACRLADAHGGPSPPPHDWQYWTRGPSRRERAVRVQGSQTASRKAAGLVIRGS